MKVVLIKKVDSSVSKRFPLSIVEQSVLTGDGWVDGEMIAGADADELDAFVGDRFASDAINFQMIDGGATDGDLPGYTWQVVEG